MLNSIPHATGKLRNPDSTRTPIVCVVDPQAGDYQNWDSLAEANGVQLRLVASAAEALRLSRTATVDLWVINADLPGLSGFELCGMLRGRATSAPVYLVANEYSPAAERAALQSRATLFGCKPGHENWLADWLASRALVGPVCRTGPLSVATT